MADNEFDIDATEIALDAQKAFDSVYHHYIITMLNRIRLAIFVPILKLSYQNLKNDIFRNGKIGKFWKWSEIGQCRDLLIIHISYTTITKKH